MRTCDVAILGGGVAAWACAATLADAGLSCAVLLRRGARLSVGEYLPPEGIVAAAALGLGDLLDNSAHRCCPGTLSLWGSGAPLRRDVLLQPGGRALCLDRTAFEEDLQAKAEAKGAATIPVSVLPKISGEPGAWLLKGPEVLHAGYLVDATGRAARLARALGACIIRPDALTGLAVYYNNVPVAGGGLRVEALPEGWCYAAPLSGDRLVAVVMTDIDLLPPGGAARSAFAQACLADSHLVGPLLLAAKEADAVRGVPSGSQLTDPSCGPGWAAIGDAAMAFDPLASAGLTKAFLDIREVMRSIFSGSSGLATAREERFAGYRRALAAAYLGETRFGGPLWARRLTAWRETLAQSS